MHSLPADGDDATATQYRQGSFKAATLVCELSSPGRVESVSWVIGKAGLIKCPGGKSAPLGKNPSQVMLGKSSTAWAWTKKNELDQSSGSIKCNGSQCQQAFKFVAVKFPPGGGCGDAIANIASLSVKLKQGGPLCLT